METSIIVPVHVDVLANATDGTVDAILRVAKAKLDGAPVAMRLLDDATVIVDGRELRLAEHDMVGVQVWVSGHHATA